MKRSMRSAARQAMERRVHGMERMDRKEGVIDRWVVRGGWLVLVGALLSGRDMCLGSNQQARMEAEQRRMEEDARKKAAADAAASTASAAAPAASGTATAGPPATATAVPGATSVAPSSSAPPSP